MNRKLETIDKHLYNLTQEFEETMQQSPGFHSRYGSNNIVIVPTTESTKKSTTAASSNLEKLKPQTPQVIEQNVPAKAISEQLSAVSSIELKPTFSMDQFESKLPVDHVKLTQTSPETLEDENKNVANVENLNKTKKVNSWASNYLQSIGHNNIKPIKITLSSKNKIQKIETISTQSNESQTVAQPTLLTDPPSLYEGFNMTDNHEFSKSNEDMVVKHINVGNIKTLHPTSECRSITNETSDMHVKIAPISSRCDNMTPVVNSTIVLDKIYSNKNSKALVNTTLLPKDNDQTTYCFDGNSNHHQFDILDAIKSKINCEYAIEQKSRAINLHKNMCEEFIKEISNNKPSVSERKGTCSKASTPVKKKEPVMSKIKKKHSAAKFESNIKKLVKKEKIIPDKESAKSTKNNNAGKEQSKKSEHICSEVDKAKAKKKHFNKQQVKKPIIDLKDFEKKVDQENLHYKKQQSKKPLIDLKDSDNLGKHFSDQNLQKEKQPKTQSNSQERQNLKRVHTNSDLLNSSSEIRTHSPIRSVVLVAEKCQNNSPKRQCLEESFDLRSKLSRLNQRIYKRQIENDLSKKSKQLDNLKITVENQNNEKVKSPKKSGVLKYKTKKCKKLKLIINVVCQGSDNETTSSDSSDSETENTPTHNMDLSFLDDINVDEIVDSLKHSPKHKIKSPLPHDSKMQDITKMPAESDVKLATILNMLNVKSETSKFKTLGNTNCTNVIKSHIHKKNDTKVNLTEGKNTSHSLVKLLPQTKLQLQQQKPPPLDDGYLRAKCCIPDKKLNAGVNINQADDQRSEDKIDESVIINEQEISIIDLTDENECAISETNKFGNTTTSSKKYIEGKQVVLKTEEVRNSVYNSGNKQKNANENYLNNKLNNHLNPITDNLKKNSKSLTAHKMDVETVMAILHKNDEGLVDLTNDIVDSNIKLNLPTVKTTVSVTVKDNITAEDINSNNKKCITITEAVKQQNVKTSQKTNDIVSEILIEQEYLQSITLPNVDIHSTKEMLVDNETLIITNEKGIHKNTDNQSKNKNLKENVKVSNHNLEIKEIAIKNTTDKESFAAKLVTTETQISERLSNKNISNQTENEKLKEIEKYSNDNSNTKEININEKDNTNRELFTTKPVNAVVNSDTIKVRNVLNAIIKSKELNLKESFTDEHETIKETLIKSKEENIKESFTHDIIKETHTATKDTDKDNLNKNINEVFEPKEASKVVKNIIENYIENKSKDNNDTKTEIQPKSASMIGNDAKIESTSTDNVIDKKVKNEPIIIGQYKAQVSLLEERMLGYLHREIKIIKHIRQGKYSNIFSCKDSNGQTYAAKVLTNQNYRHTLGIQKEQMIRQLQQDIPRENLNTIYLIDGFGVERYWCFLTEYYPINLQQVLKQRNKPFHLQRVQNLARQLISAVIVLRNNKIVHSDIKPSHILLNSNDRLKLCGFDSACYINNLIPLPNIGTVNYRAPEIIIGFSAGYSIDVWSSALVIHEMATNLRLFSGIYNNDILYKQMCMFGNLSRDMIETSVFQNRHFQGRTFMRRVGYKGQDAILFNKFYKTKRLQASTIAAYNTHWQTKDVQQRKADMLKLSALNKLLESMLLLDPRFRLAIEFVCADPFIYEMFT